MCVCVFCVFALVTSPPNQEAQREAERDAAAVRGFQRRRVEMHRLQKELETVKEELQEMQLTVRASVAILSVERWFSLITSRSGSIWTNKGRESNSQTRSAVAQTNCVCALLVLSQQSPRAQRDTVDVVDDVNATDSDNNEVGDVNSISNGL